MKPAVIYYDQNDLCVRFSGIHFSLDAIPGHIKILPEDSDWREPFDIDQFKELHVVGQFPQIVPLNAVELEAVARGHAKNDRAMALAMLTVEVGGNVFQADEFSRASMKAAIETAEFRAQTVIVGWSLANNDVVDVSVADMKEAVALAWEARTASWVL